MAGNLVERLKAALSPRARVTDTEKLLADLKAEQARLTIARDQAAADSVDFALSEDDREDAASKAGRLDRTIKSLDTEIAKVAALLEERRSDDVRRAKEAEKRAALTERDELAARFAERVPAMTAELIGLLKEVKANAERMKLAGVHEADAELVARGIPATGHLQMTPVPRFTEMKIPAFRGLERAWPIDHERQMINRGLDLSHQARLDAFERADREAKAKAEAAAEYQRTHARYQITVQASVEEPDAVVRIPEELVAGNIPAAMGPWDRKQLMISHEVADKLAAVPRLQVKRLDGGKK